MPEIPHAMTYAPLPDAPAMPPVFQCCAQWFYLAHQAMFHLWHEHGFTAEAAWAQIDVVRGVSVPAQLHGSNAAPPIQAQPLPPLHPWAPSSAPQAPPSSIAAEKQALVDASLARFQAKIT